MEGQLPQKHSWIALVASMKTFASTAALQDDEGGGDLAMSAVCDDWPHFEDFGQKPTSHCDSTSKPILI